MSKELNDEELDKVVGGSHVDPDDIDNYVGKDMLYSYGSIFHLKGPWPVHINSVNNKIVNLTFTDPNQLPTWATNPNQSLPNNTWKRMGGLTFEFDYDTTYWEWLE